MYAVKIERRLELLELILQTRIVKRETFAKLLENPYEVYEIQAKYKEVIAANEATSKPPFDILEEAYFGAVNDFILCQEIKYPIAELIEQNEKEIMFLNTVIDTIKRCSEWELSKEQEKTSAYYDELKGYKDDYTDKEREYLLAKSTALDQAIRISQGFHDRSKPERLR